MSPSRVEYTTCTVAAPDAVFTMRTYAAPAHPTTHNSCANQVATSNKSRGKRLAESLKAETWPKSGLSKCPHRTW
jgi:hypothetical protein